MKKSFLLGLPALLLAVTADAEFQVGNGAFQLDTSLTGVYDSNLRASVNDVDDFYLNFSPTLRYKRLGARFQTEASAGVHVKRYLDTTTSNSEDADAQFDWRMNRADGHTTGANLGLRYLETSDAELDVNEQVRTKSFSASTSGEVLVSGRNLLTGALTHRDYQRNIGNNQQSTSGRLGYSYIGFTDGTALHLNYARQESKSEENATDDTVLDQTADTATIGISRPLYAELTAGLTYGYRWLDRGFREALLGLPDSKGSFYALNFEGPFLPRQYFPKTTGTFRLSYEQAETPGLNDRSNERLVGQIDLSWAARENTTVGFFASRSQNLSITDNTVVNESTGFTLRQAIGAFVDADFSLRYTNADFVNLVRTDDRYEARAGATYRLNRVWSATGSYSYLRSESTAAIANYSRHVVSGTVNYAF